MRLDEVQPGKILRISHLIGGRGLHLNLARLGIYEGDKIKVLETAPFGGPVLVEHLSSGAKVAIGRGMAKKILVEEITDNSK